jgi:hypothetical protein
MSILCVVRCVLSAVCCVLYMTWHITAAALCRLRTPNQSLQDTQLPNVNALDITICRRKGGQESTDGCTEIARLGS